MAVCILLDPIILFIDLPEQALPKVRIALKKGWALVEILDTDGNNLEVISNTPATTWRRGIRRDTLPVPTSIACGTATTMTYTISF